MTGFRYKHINRLFGKAIHHYDMISDGDRIAVGVSGGSDSMTLMWFLHERLRRILVTYELFPIYIDPGFEGGFSKPFEAYCRKMSYNFKVEFSNHGPLAHSPANRENPCFLCSRLRRKRLFEIADDLGCNKLALGHNKDDIIETLFLNMCYTGEMSTMMPVQSMFNGRLKVIRPLAYVDKETITGFAKDFGIPTFHNPCPSAGVSKRKEIKTLLSQLYRSNRKIKGNIFRSMSHVKKEYLP